MSNELALTSIQFTEELYHWNLGHATVAVQKNRVGYLLAVKVDRLVQELPLSLSISSRPLDEEILKAYCRATYSMLTRLSDGSYRVQLLVRGEGGMMEETESTNYKIYQSLKEAPGNFFNHVAVRTIMHRFINDHFDFDVRPNPVPLGCITLTVGNCDSAANFFRHTFTYALVPNPDVSEKEKYVSLINFNTIQAVLSGIDNTDEQYKGIIGEFRRNATFRIFFSYDLKYVEIRPESKPVCTGCIIL